MPVLQVYGSTETCPIAVYTRLGGDLSRAGSTGLPGLVCEARIVDADGREVPHGTAGEIAVRGPNVFFEYWGNEAATREALRDGWYRTGDIGRRDADGYFFVHDRKKNMIISGGENIYPAEVERVLHAKPPWSPRARIRKLARGCRSPCIVRRARMSHRCRCAQSPRVLAQLALQSAARVRLRR